MTVRELQVWPWPIMPNHLEHLKRAKAELDLDYKIQPVQAVPGIPGRVLCLGELAPFVTEAVLSKNPDDYQSILGALRFMLTTHTIRKDHE